jgi:hypothetical protein
MSSTCRVERLWAWGGLRRARAIVVSVRDTDDEVHYSTLFCTVAQHQVTTPPSRFKCRSREQQDGPRPSKTSGKADLPPCRFLLPTSSVYPSFFIVLADNNNFRTQSTKTLFRLQTMQ